MNTSADDQTEGARRYLMSLSLFLGGIFFASLAERTAYEVHPESTEVVKQWM